MPPLSRRLLRIAFYIATALVGLLSLAPAAALPPAPLSDKVEHVMAYALLGLLGGASSQRGVLRTILGLSAFGIAIEMLQAFSPGRSPDPLDVLADILSAAWGCGAAGALRLMTSLPEERIASASLEEASRPKRSQDGEGSA